MLSGVLPNGDHSTGRGENIAIVRPARLPQTYEAARHALSECQNIDECKDWADKAAALASYAKQAEDETLMKMAVRIKARAVRRSGELLKQIEPANGTRTDLQPSMGDRTRSDAAREAGMSKHQQVQSTRIANIPERDFDEQVESDNPPTLSQLASQGIQRRDPPDPQSWLKGRDKKSFNRALHFTGDITEYAATVRKWDLSVLEHLDDEQRTEIRNALRVIDGIHDAIATRI